MTNGYEPKCPKCYTPVDQIKREWHKVGECRTGNSGTEHIEWTCRCGYRWLSYPR